jgi:putative transposase
MPAYKKNHNTSQPLSISVKVTSADLPEEQDFHQHLRQLICGATRVVMEEIMQEELTQFLRADWGESTSERQGYRNGTYQRDLITSTGKIKDVKVPRVRYLVKLLNGITMKKFGPMIQMPML